MTRPEFFEIAGYFANPIRNTRIEIEAIKKTIDHFAQLYLDKTGLEFPFGADSVTSLTNDANKWGREMRLYFTNTNNAGIPDNVRQFMTVGGRPGYELWHLRVNSLNLIDDLFDHGFTLGSPQDLIRIQGFIPGSDLNNFNMGFNAP